MMGEGKAWKFSDNISTDLIAPGRYSHLRTNLPELAKHTLEDADIQGVDENFVDVVEEGDYVVAGKNFGLGSSREHAPRIIKLSGVRAVLGRSFARIFFRNSINVGLAPIQCDTTKIENGDRLQVNLEEGNVENLTKEIRIEFDPIPKIPLRILEDGGLVSHVKKNQGLALSQFRS